LEVLALPVRSRFQCFKIPRIRAEKFSIGCRRWFGETPQGFAESDKALDTGYDGNWRENEPIDNLN
jgi:hypothetical protein